MKAPSLSGIGTWLLSQCQQSTPKNGQAAHQYQANWRCRVSQPPTDSLQPFSKGRWPRLYSWQPSHDERKSSQAQLNLRALAWRFTNVKCATANALGKPGVNQARRTTAHRDFTKYFWAGQANVREQVNQPVGDIVMGQRPAKEIRDDVYCLVPDFDVGRRAQSAEFDLRKARIPPGRSGRVAARIKRTGSD
jgi:hypothetical protein